ncbi:rh5-interacting protein-like [Arctopsyche grandis]|uniref:rh5-interacting protein-like n=1 Tax=Arctopsyche grandis TaxID=121162 RepID=UPI00406D8886
MVKWFIVLILALAITNQVFAGCGGGGDDDDDDDNGNNNDNTETCGLNEVLSKNGFCRRTCNIRNVDPNCVIRRGCICDLVNGYLRNSKGDCVLAENCDPPCEGDLGKVFNKCGDSCQKSCRNMNDPDWTCTESCVTNGACRCVEGLVQNDFGNCVEPRHCEKQCPRFESYSACLANGCENTCEDPKKRMNNCPYPTCRTGCVCNENWLRDDNGQCIPSEQCGASCDGDPNSYLSKCATKCDNWKCSDIEDLAAEILCRATGQCNNVEACVCKPDYFRQDGMCIPRKDCRKCYGENEAFLCRRCELKCGGVIDQSCLEEKDCVEGCYCKKGYARNCHGVCVPLKKCEQESCNGDPNAYYEQCDIRCRQKTCEFPNGPTICTPGVCVKNGDCVCKDGYVLGPNNKCIPLEYCDYRPKSCLPPPTLPPYIPYIPPTLPPPPQCGMNEEPSPNPYADCPDQTCEMYFKGLQSMCEHYQEPRQPVCKCKPAFVRNNKGDCILPLDCCDDPNAMVVAGPNTCPGGTCKNPLFEKCDNPWQPYGCECKPEYVKISDCNPICIPKKDCCNYD